MSSFYLLRVLGFPCNNPRLPSVCFPPISRPRGGRRTREMATAPRPPAFVSSAGPPARQRRAALDFLARELQALEIESRVKQDLETRVSSLERDLHRSEQLNAQYLRRIDMLEQQLRHARGEGPAPAEQEAASSGGEVFQGLATMVPPTSLAAAAAKLPLPPPPLAPFDDGADAPQAPRPFAEQRGLFVPAAEMADAVQDGEDDEFDIDRLIQEQRDQPLPQASVSGNRAPIALRVARPP